tara:strand:+ start:277 stop:483 length:207 start_codon:yes stop_codon:yes gene_type:complete
MADRVTLKKVEKGDYKVYVDGKRRGRIFDSGLPGMLKWTVLFQRKWKKHGSMADSTLKGARSFFYERL